MKNFNEWKSEQYDNPDRLIDNLTGLSEKMKHELEAFTGERFDGFMEVIGSVRGIQKNLAALNTGTKPPEWASAENEETE